MSPALPKECENFKDIDYSQERKGGVNPAITSEDKCLPERIYTGKRLPSWLRQEIPDNKTLEILSMLSKLKIDTVCKFARCPNLSRCFKNRELTFMILGDTCTRSCKFCAVKKSRSSILNVDRDEPLRIAALVKSLALDYVVITSVSRDDLSDGGAAQFAGVIKHIQRLNQKIKIEVLIPDFRARISSLKAVIAAQPSVIGHNIETVKRLHRQLKPDSSYEISLTVLKKIKEIDPGQISKSSFILGLGEKEDEVIGAMEDLRKAQCDILILGQYLSPGLGHYPVKDFISIERFQKYQEIGLDLGFKAVLSAPLARSSFKAAQLYREVSHA